MSRNQQNDIANGIQAWDETMNDNIAVLQDNPLPIVEYATIGSIPNANLHDRSLAMGNHAERGWCPFFSDGTNWVAARPFHIIALSVNNVGATTSEDFFWGSLDSAGDTGIPMLADGRIVSFAVSTRHLHGSQPAAWTLTVTNETTATSVTASVGFNATDDAHEATVNKFSAVLAVNAGDEISASIAGSSITTVIAGLQLLVDLDLTTTVEVV